VTEKKRYVRKRVDKLSDHIEKKTDPWSVASKRKLKASMRHKIKRTFVPLLDAIDKEKADGKIDSATHRRLRSKALNSGNDQIRNMEMEIDSRYNVEALNYHIEFKVIQPEEHEDAG
jgi:hypothetical protein